MAVSSNLKRRTFRFFVIATCLGLITLSGCASNSSKTTANIPETAPANSVSEPAKPETIADRPFSSDTLYALLVAEMAIDRKRYDIALGNYVQQALRTQDQGVASRATHIARSLNARQSALEMSQLWLDLEPANPDARLIATVELIEANHLLEAFKQSKIMLEQGESTTFESIAMKAEKGDITIVNTLAKEYAALLNIHKKDSGLWLGQSILLMQSGDLNNALKAAQEAKKLEDGNIRSAFQETRVLHKMGKTDLARERLLELVEAHPKNVGLRARYARIVWSSSPDEARKQFLILHEQSPADAEILYSLALVEKDLGLLESAQTRFNLLISRNQYVGDAHYFIGEIFESQTKNDEALEKFKQVTPGQNYINAIIKVTDIYIAQNERANAIEFVKDRKAKSQGNTRQSLFMLEADIYSKAGQTNAAEKVLSASIEEFPNSTRLLYARAMLYAQIDYVSAAEKDLKKVLELVPENAAALNALGYTLADRTDRYQEAYEYIKQAYALTPDDPAVIDSLGWVAYRLGNYEEALLRLRQAMSSMPDHEIAAHLGEVLWVTGNHSEAIAVWKRGLELHPDSEIIHKTLHRLEAKID